MKRILDFIHFTALGWISLKKRWLRGDLINVYQYLKGGYQEDGASIFPGVSSCRTRGKGQKLKHKKFHLNMKNFFTVCVTEHWNKLPREVVESPSLEIFKNGLDSFSSNVIQVDPALVGRMDQMSHCGPFEPHAFSNSVIPVGCF
ncbi:hypothetical protein DUI87_12734 [Hirundo rustica rustica]|uniref:Uncharacterized protein n=1 Tax=Hirundo rustica rustica TaxID=333673 RepID=A0A3M0KS35_HIRRU|nr:hypothetical protein DUI87_12734 [Hirundo rustica rustica]